MTATLIRQKLYDYIRVAEDKKIKAIYTMVEDDLNEKYDFWNDENFVKELDKRTTEYKNGKVKGVLWNDVKSKIGGSINRPKK